MGHCRTGATNLCIHVAPVGFTVSVQCSLFPRVFEAAETRGTHCRVRFQALELEDRHGIITTAGHLAVSRAGNVTVGGFHGGCFVSAEAVCTAAQLFETTGLQVMCRHRRMQRGMIRNGGAGGEVVMGVRGTCNANRYSPPRSGLSQPTMNGT